MQSKGGWSRLAANSRMSQCWTSQGITVFSVSAPADLHPRLRMDYNTILETLKIALLLELVA